MEGKVHQARRRASTAALGVSLLLHLALLASLVWVKPAPVPVPSTRPITVEIVQLQRRPPAHPPPVRAAAPAPPPMPAAPHGRAHEALAQAAAPPADAPRPEAPDAPRSVFLGPSIHSRALEAMEVPGLEAPDAGTSGGGHLVRNGPGAEPGAEERWREESAHVKALTEGFARDTFAERRVTNGLVDPYFDGLQKALAEKTKHPPELHLPPVQVLEGWAQGASHFGKTGNPYASGKPELGDDQDNIALLAQQQATGAGAGAGLQGGFANTAQMLAMVRDFAAPAEPSITAVVELLQEPDGRFRSARLLAKSGDTRFDAFVMDAAPEAVKGLQPPPDHGSGLHGDTLHTVWAFRGHRVFLKEVKDFEGKGGKAAAVAEGALATLTGSGQFDVTTGQVRVPDYAHPRYACTVRLLRVY